MIIVDSNNEIVITIHEKILTFIDNNYECFMKLTGYEDNKLKIILNIPTKNENISSQYIDFTNLFSDEDKAMIQSKDLLELGNMISLLIDQCIFKLAIHDIDIESVDILKSCHFKCITKYTNGIVNEKMVSIIF